MPTNSAVSNAGIIKNVAFRSEALPVVGASTGFLPLVVSLGLILWLIPGELPSSALLPLPIAFRLQILFVSGLGLLLAALNIFVRHKALALPNLLTLLPFASPIFYPPKTLPAYWWGGPTVQHLLRDCGLLPRTYRRWRPGAAVDVCLSYSDFDCTFYGWASLFRGLKSLDTRR